MQLSKTEGKFVETRIDDELVLMNVDTGSFFSLKRTGLAIWEALDSNKDNDSIKEVIGAKYLVPPDQCAAEVDAFLGQAIAAGLVTLG